MRASAPNTWAPYRSLEPSALFVFAPHRTFPRPLRSPVSKPRAAPGPGPSGPFAGAVGGRGGGGGSGGGGGRGGGVRPLAGRGVALGGRGGGGGIPGGAMMGAPMGGGLFPGGGGGGFAAPPGLDLDGGVRGGSGGGGAGKQRGGGSGGGGAGGAALAQHNVGGHHYASAHAQHAAGHGRSLLAAQFMGEGLRQQLQQCAYLAQAAWAPGPDEPALPPTLGAHFHTLCPLEDLAAAEEHPSGALGVRTAVLKGVSARDGAAYALRRVDGRQVVPSAALVGAARQAVDAWSAVGGHPGLSCPREAFVSADLDAAPALVVAYAYHPGAVTLARAHLAPAQAASGQLVRNAPTEATLWSYAAQVCDSVIAIVIACTGIDVCYGCGAVLVVWPASKTRSLRTLTHSPSLSLFLPSPHFLSRAARRRAARRPRRRPRRAPAGAVADQGAAAAARPRAHRRARPRRGAVGRRRARRRRPAARAARRRDGAFCDCC